MNSDLVCTLFERDYHHGVVTLVNSLCRNGFSGKIYAGYKGDLPNWALGAKHRPNPGNIDTTVIDVTSEVEIHFVPITTALHLTNFKPDFMSRVWELNENSDVMYYLDPDIIICEKWGYFRRWASSGIALCEDWNSPLPLYHPRRMCWREFYQEFGFKLRPREAIYANGGLLGLHRSSRDFVILWKSMLEVLGFEIGGLDRSAIGAVANNGFTKTFADPFCIPDQDALNAACEATGDVVSVMNKTAMGWGYGHCVAAHAINSPKPWSKIFLKGAFRGEAPSIADKLYWRSEQEPLRSHSARLVRWKRFELLTARFIAALLR